MKKMIYNEYAGDGNHVPWNSVVDSQKDVEIVHFSCMNI